MYATTGMILQMVAGATSALKQSNSYAQRYDATISTATIAAHRTPLDARAAVKLFVCVAPPVSEIAGRRLADRVRVRQGKFEDLDQEDLFPRLFPLHLLGLLAAIDRQNVEVAKQPCNEK